VKTVIFTDLDGSLLHPKTYSFEEALPALRLIRETGVPLVLCSSKTRAEIEVYRRRLGSAHPFIAENGGGIFIPAGYFPFAVNGDLLNDYIVISLGTSYRDIRKTFAGIREASQTTVIGFGDMDASEIAAATGLSPEEAALAKEREFDEPFMFQGGSDGRFLKGIEDAGFRWTQGRFFHMLGNSDKGTAVHILKKHYEREHGRIKSVGIGDSLNDLPLLREVDYPVLIRREDGSHEERVKVPNLIRTEGIGPAGWAEAVLELLKR
jgi:mannosyl-3-phosphoglycerate phosphatase family protein